MPSLRTFSGERTDASFLRKKHDSERTTLSPKPNTALSTIGGCCTVSSCVRVCVCVVAFSQQQQEKTVERERVAGGIAQQSHYYTNENIGLKGGNKQKVVEGEEEAEEGRELMACQTRSTHVAPVHILLFVHITR